MCSRFGSDFQVADKSTAISPILYMSIRSTLHPETISKNHTLKYIDTRRFSPFALLTSVFDFPTYVHVYHKLYVFEKTAELRSVKAMYKKFEKELFMHIKSRKELRSLLLDLIHPEHELPIWYKEWLLKTGHSTENKDNVLKTELAELKKNNTMYYEGIMAYIDFQLTLRLDSICDFSERFQSADEQRNTSSSHFIMNTKKPIEIFFQTLLGILTDVYIILCIVKNTSDTVAFVGDVHVATIYQFYRYSDLLKSTKVYKRTEDNDYLDYDVPTEIQ
jgi:hypothetical protein